MTESGKDILKREIDRYLKKVIGLVALNVSSDKAKTEIYKYVKAIGQWVRLEL